MHTVTFDSTERPDSQAVTLALRLGWKVAYVSVTGRESAGTDFEIILKGHEQLPEVGVWDESNWDEARYADESDAQRLESILEIIGNHSFPRNRADLTKGQLHQLRDAMILEAHSAAARTIFVTSDTKGFIKNGRREQLQILLQTRIRTPAEFIDEFDPGASDA